MQLYEKTTHGKSVRYIPHVPPPPAVPKKSEFTDAELIMLATTLGLTVLMELRTLMPPHKFIPRKVLAVEEAILSLSHGSGGKIDMEMAEYWLDCWSKTMLEIQRGLVESENVEV